MSRIGKLPIPVPAGVTVNIAGSSVTVKGPKGELTRSLPAEMHIAMEGSNLLVTRPSDDNKQGLIKIALKYHPQTKAPAIKSLRRISSPGLRKYTGSTELPRVLNGLGIAIISTSQGLKTGQQAWHQKSGGELLCYVW